MNTLAVNLMKNTSKMVLAGIQLERTALSYPVPVMLGEQRGDRYFLFVNVASAVRSRPFAVMTLASEDGSLMEYMDCRIFDFAESSGIALNQQLNYASPAKVGVRKLMEIKKEYAALYEKIREFAFNETLTADQSEVLRQYKECEELLLNPQMKEFYRLLSPEFEEWKNRMTTK